MDNIVEGKGDIVHTPVIVWAKFPGYSPWPARVCSAFEEKSLREILPTRLANATGVVFLGSKKERAWITKNNHFPFHPSDWDTRIDRKKFANDRDYRVSIIEGVRIMRKAFRDQRKDIVDSMIESSKEFSGQVTSFCTACGGSNFSGGFIACHYCQAVEVHWHCFHPDDSDAEEGKLSYICKKCCEERKLPKGSMVYHPAPSGNDQQSGEAISDAGGGDDEDETAAAGKSSSNTKKNSNSNSKNNSKKRSRKEMMMMDQSSEEQDNDSELTADLQDGFAAAVGHSHSHSKQKANNVTFASSTAEAAGLGPTTTKGYARISQRLERTLFPDGRSTASATSTAGGGEASSMKLDLEEVENTCGVCHEGGMVFGCDYPFCPKVYHQVCVAKVFIHPLPLDTGTGGGGYDDADDDCTEGGKKPANHGQQQEWYCPRHYCLECGAMQTMPGTAGSVTTASAGSSQTAAATSATTAAVTVDVMTLPPSVYTYYARYPVTNNTYGSTKTTRNNGSIAIRQAILKQCHGCLVAVCSPCEELIQEQAQYALFTNTTNPNNNNHSNLIQPFIELMPATDGVASSVSSRRRSSASSSSQQPAPDSNNGNTASNGTTLATANGHGNSNGNGSGNSTSNGLTTAQLQKGCQSATCINCYHDSLYAHTSVATYLANNVTSTSTATSSVNKQTSILYASKMRALAKILEIAWMRMTNTRLAIPLLRPILPMIQPSYSTVTATTTSHQSSAVAGQQSKEKKQDIKDFMSIIEHIHAGVYHHFTDFIQDVHKVFTLAKERLRSSSQKDLDDASKPASSSSRSSSSSSSSLDHLLTLTIATLEETMMKYLHSRDGDLEELQEEIALLLIYVDCGSNSEQGQDKGKADSQMQPSTSSPLLPWRIECHYHALTYLYTQKVNTSYCSSSSNSGNTSISKGVISQILRSQQRYLPVTDKPLTSSSSSVLLAMNRTQATDLEVLVTSRTIPQWISYLQMGDSQWQAYQAEYLQEVARLTAATTDAEETTDQSANQEDKPLNHQPLYLTKQQLALKNILGQGSWMQKVQQEQSAKSLAQRFLAYDHDQRKHDGSGYTLDEDITVPRSYTVPGAAGSGSDSSVVDQHAIEGLLSLSSTMVGQGQEELLAAYHHQPVAHRDHGIMMNSCSKSNNNGGLLLQRMQEMTEQLLALQKRYEYETTLRQQQAFLTGSEVITIGEASLVAELKLSNDQLRWKILQRDRIIQNQQQQIEFLQQTVQSQHSQSRNNSSSKEQPASNGQLQQQQQQQRPNEKDGKGNKEKAK